MRYRLMASFQGASYQAGVGPSDEEVTLFAACPPPEELGFRSSSNHWRKRVGVDEIDALWEARPIGRYRGERCMVLDDLGDRMHIAYLGRDLYLARRLGFWEVDRGVFEGRGAPAGDRRPAGRARRVRTGPAARDGDGNGLGWNDGSVPTWAHTPREYGAGAGHRAAAHGGAERADRHRAVLGRGHPPARPAPGCVLGQPGHPRRGSSGHQHLGRGRPPGGDAGARQPVPRGRGGWRARDTGGWEANEDPAAWDPREVERAPATRPVPTTGVPAYNGADHNNGGHNNGGQNARPAEQADRWSTQDYSPAGPPATGTVPTSPPRRTPPPVAGPAGRSRATPTRSGTGTRRTRWPGTRPRRASGTSPRPGTGSGNDAARPAAPPTQDAAAVWHGSPSRRTAAAGARPPAPRPRPPPRRWPSAGRPRPPGPDDQPARAPLRRPAGPASAPAFTGAPAAGPGRSRSRGNPGTGSRSGTSTQRTPHRRHPTPAGAVTSAAGRPASSG